MFFPPQCFYYTGFCAGEMSCSIIKASNKTGGFYYTPDVTVSNNDKELLQEINSVVAQGKGIISSIKGGYNLSIRGKNKVKIALSFFEKYPFITGDIVNCKIDILRQAVNCLSEKRVRNIRSSMQETFIEGCRSQLRELKETGLPLQRFESISVDKSAIGYFLCGVFDAEGSAGLKRCRGFYQSFIAIAMKDEKIVELFRDFLGYGYIHYRPKDQVYHYETASFWTVFETVELFTEVYPSKQQHMKGRLEKLKGILNDHTRDAKHTPIYYDGKTW